MSSEPRLDTVVAAAATAAAAFLPEAEAEEESRKRTVEKREATPLLPFR
jgi:hypothetical protein